MEECLFCKIVNGEIPSHKVYEDENSFAFLDIESLSEGHTLIIPKNHHVLLSDMTEDDLGKLFACVKKVLGMVSRATNASGFSILQRNGKAAGQVIDHVHVHIIPRHEGDGLGFTWNTKKLSEEELKRIADKIRNVI